MAEMRLAVYVINGGGDVKLFAHQGGQSEGQRRRWQSCDIGTIRPRRRHRSRNRIKVGFFEDENEDEEDLFATRTTLHACCKAVPCYNTFRLWRKTSRQTKTA
jgi:hypothetical protein